MPPGHLAKVDHTRFAAMDTEAEAYWLGFLATDGCVGGTRAIVQLALAAKDGDHVTRFADFLRAETRPRTYTVTTKPPSQAEWRDVRRTVFCVRSRLLVENLARAGVGANKTWTVRPWPGPPDLLRHYWRGCMDGDGTLGISRGNRHFSYIGNEPMVRGIASFVEAKTGREAHLRRRTVSRSGQITWRAEWGGNLVAKAIAELLYRGATVSLPRKQAKADDAMAHESPMRLRWASRDDLLDLFREHGSWAAVGEHLGVTPSNIVVQAKRRGITAPDLAPYRKRKPWTRSLPGVTREQILAAKSELGSWAKVAHVFQSSVQAVRRRVHGRY